MASYDEDDKVEFTRGQLEQFKEVAGDFLHAAEKLTWDHPSPAMQVFGMQAVKLREFVDDLGKS